MPRYAALIYNGYWWSPERRALQTLIDHTQTKRQRLGAPEALQGQRDGRRRATRRPTRCSITNIATFEDDGGAYNQKDADGFIQLNALRMRIAARRRHR